MEDIIELANEPGQQAILRSAPWLRFGLEKVFQKDVFTNRELQAVNNANEFKLALDLHKREDLPDFVKAPFTKLVNWLELKRDPSNRKKIIGNPDKLHMLRSGFTSRWQSIIGSATKEDQEMWVTSVRFLTGHMVIEPDQKQKRSIEKSMTIKEIRDEALKNNIARPLGMFFVGGRKMDRDMANMYIKRALEGGTVQRQRRIREQFKKRAERIKKGTIGR